MMRRYGGMLTAWATILYMLMYRGASSVDVDNNSTKICRLLCRPDQDTGNTDASDADRCVVACERLFRSFLEWKNRLQQQEKPAEDSDEKLIRSNRAWIFPDLSKWQARMLMSGIGSRSRSAGSYLRIGRDYPETAQHGGKVKRRRGRMRSAGRYLRIGRAGESADPELMASGAAHDGRPEEEIADMLHLRKVNRDVPVHHNALQ